MKTGFNKISFGILIVAVLTVILIQSTVTFSNNPEDDPSFDLYYVPHPGYLKMMSLGFNGFAADLYWIRTVIYSGRRSFDSDFEYAALPLRGDVSGNKDFLEWQKDASYRFRYLYDMLNVVTELDPYFLIPYTFGGLFLSYKGNRPDLSVELLNKGLEYLPDSWRIHYFLGFNYFFYLNDSVKTVDHFRLAARNPECPRSVISLTQKLLVKAGKKSVAIEFLTGLKEQTNDLKFREELERILNDLKKETKESVKLESYPRLDLKIDSS